MFRDAPSNTIDLGDFYGPNLRPLHAHAPSYTIGLGEGWKSNVRRSNKGTLDYPDPNYNKHHDTKKVEEETDSHISRKPEEHKKKNERPKDIGKDDNNDHVGRLLNMVVTSEEY